MSEMTEKERKYTINNKTLAGKKLLSLSVLRVALCGKKLLSN